MQGKMFPLLILSLIPACGRDAERPAVAAVAHEASFAASAAPAGLGDGYSTFIGGSGDDYGYGIAVGPDGAAYVVGFTSSSNFPYSTGAYDTTYSNGDAFVVKLNPQGTAAEFATFLGGSSSDMGRRIALDTLGNIYVAGWTLSSDFPITSGAYQNYRVDTSQQTAFVTKLNPAGTALIYSTFLGSGWNGNILTGGIDASALGIDAQGAACVGGLAPGVGGIHSFFVKLNTAGSGVAYLTNLRSSGFYTLWVQDAEADALGNCYAAGYTDWTDFPVTTGAADTTLEYSGASSMGYHDGFIMKLSPLGVTTYATLLGGNNVDRLIDIAVDARGNVVAVGDTQSSNFPLSPRAFWAGSSLTAQDSFVTILSADGSEFLASTRLGGSLTDWATGVALDARGNVYVAGTTSSQDLPTTARAFRQSYSTGATNNYVVKLNRGLSREIYGTYLGPVDWFSYVKAGVGLRGNAFVAGSTGYASYPTTATAFDTSFNGAYDAYVTKLGSSGGLP